MARIAIGMWRANAETLPNEPVHQKLNRIQNNLTMAFRGAGQADVRVFLVPEFYFMHGNRAAEVVRWYTPAEKEQARAGVARLSQLKQNLLVVGGTICWAKEKKHFGGKPTFHVYNQAPVAFAGQELKLYAKQRAGGEHLPTDTLRLMLARKGNVDLDYLERDNNQPGVVYVTKTGNTIHDIDGYGKDKTRDGRYRSQGVVDALEKYDDRIHFETPAGEGSFRLPGTTLTGGVEICQEHNFRTLANGSRLGQVDLHLLVSNTVSHNGNNNAVREGGLMIHCDPSRPPLVMQKVNGQMTQLNGWNDVTNDGLAMIEVTI